MLDGMHRQAADRPDIDIGVVNSMHVIVERLPVNEAVYQIEMEIAQNRNDRHHRHAIDRMFAQIDVGDQLICVQPHCDHFPSGPEGHSADERPEQIIQHLITEHELRFVPRHPLVGVFEIRALGPHYMKAEVPCPENQRDEDRVPQEDVRDPAWPEGGHFRHRRSEPKPRDDGKRHIGDPPWQKIAGVAKEPLEKRHRTRRPHQHRRVT
jgi:hypothetical protein